MKSGKLGSLMDESEIRELKIVDLVNSHPEYTRLSSAINQAAKVKKLPFETVGKVLDAGPRARDSLLQIRNFGTRTAAQFFHILNQCLISNRPGGGTSSQNGSSEMVESGNATETNNEHEIVGTKIVDLVNTTNQAVASVRLSNCIKQAARQGKLPFETVGDYLAAGNDARKKFQKIRNFGRRTADELDRVIRSTFRGKKVQAVLQMRMSTQSIEDESMNQRSLKTVDSSLTNLKIVDVVNFYPTSVRLSNWINEAAREERLPFTTVGDYLAVGNSAHEKMLKVKNIGRKTVKELSELIYSIVGGGTPPRGNNIEKRFDLIEELNSKFPDVFAPLVEAYGRVREDDQIERRRLERAIKNLLKNKRTTQIIQRRFMGETLQEIGERYGITRERVRQLEAKYKEYTTDIESREWVEKAIRDLISRQEDENRLPPNETIDHYHPKLAVGLIKNFTSKNGSSLTPALRLEIAENLGLDREHELLSQTRWSVDRVILEVKKLASELGKPDLMPMQLEMVKQGRQDLRGIIGRFGGQAKVAELAGLKYQGQLVAPDGSRQYWTDERIKEFLYEVAEKNGHPGVMPTQRECREHASNPATVVSGITQVRPDRPGLTWFEVSQRYGLRYVKGVHQVTLPFIKSFVKSLGDALYSLSPAEIYVLFEQQGITKSYQNRTFDNLVDAVQSGFLPKEEIEEWTRGGKGDLVEALLDPEIQSVEEAFNSVGQEVQRKDHKKKEDNPSDEAYRENVERQLPLPTASETLDALKVATDVLGHASSDEEAVQFLIAKATDKLWKQCFLDEEAAITKAKQHQGNTYSETARNTFIEEYTRSKQLPIPQEYSFRDLNGVPRQPKLMQRLIAYRVLTQGQVLNLSGTGTGKTLSAILASRVIGARLTVVACPNATVDAWRETILNTFPQSEVIPKPSNWQISWETANIPRYVVVNHEIFQNRYEGRIKRFIQEQATDFIVIDELHKVKQRTPEQETQRRRLLTGLITDIPDNRPKPRVLGMSATPIVNNLQEGKSLVELVTSMTHDEIGSKTSVQNCMRLYQRFTTLGFRMLPKQEISREPKIYPTDATPYLEELLELGEMPHPQKVEAVLVKARWPIIRQHLRKKTVVFTEYVMDIVPYLTGMIQQDGFSVGVFTGEEKLATASGYRNMLHQFIEGETDILVASIRTLGTGVDGLQYVCNNIIFATLPWTSTDYEQAVGRFDREGFVFDSLDIHIPKTYAVLNSGQEWSWCESRLLRIENKRDIAKAAVDGEIPDTEGQLSPAKATQYWMGWLKRLNDEGLQEIERREIKVPLDESDTKEQQRRRASYGDFANLNARWNQTHSSVTHNRLAENPEEWCYYHTRLLEHEKSWQVNPRIECAKHLTENLPKGAIIGDFGCGQGHLAEALKDVHTVHSFDHIAIRPSTISCDMSHTSLDDGVLDAVVFSLSLMGTNLQDYISEAYRTLRLGGQLLIWHPAEHHDRTRFVEGLKTFGFAIVEEEQIYKWHRIWAIKQARRTEPSEEVRF